MAKQKQQASNRPATRASQRRNAANDPDRQKAEQEARDEANKRRFVDQTGIVAQDLPDAARGQNIIDAPEHTARNLPHQHGGEDGREGGVRGDRKMSDADRYGGRKRN